MGRCCFLFIRKREEQGSKIMNHRIALFADVHGNTTALKAVIQDTIRENVTDYWFLGDLIMPGPGSADLLDMLKKVNTSVYVRGNWEDCLLEVLEGAIDIADPSDVYISKLAEYQSEHLTGSEIDWIRQRPLSVVKEINGLKISISHNLPDKNHGDELIPYQSQASFDRLFSGNQCDIAVYAHVHHQMLRYSSEDQLIINPGSVGQPFSERKKFRTDMRAQYAIIDIDDQGVPQITFKKVGYDIAEELQTAKRREIPYFDLYKELLETDLIHTHDKALLKEVNRHYGYVEEVTDFLRKIESGKALHRS